MVNILLIYTGGTIGMVKNPKTGALRTFNFDNLFTQIPELKLLSCAIETHEFENPIDSSNMNIEEWQSLGDVISSSYDDYDGFVILHGSDTMSYTGSALSFMFQNLSKPIIMTGSQLPIGDLRTDAKENLITSIQIASMQKEGVPVIQEVGLYFEYKLYRANRTTKINAEHFEAFASLNYPMLVESGVHLKVFHQNISENKDGRVLLYYRNMIPGVVIVKLFPGMNKQMLDCLTGSSAVKVVILETYGAGNAPTVDWFIQGLKNLIQYGVHVINVTQCSVTSCPDCNQPK